MDLLHVAISRVPGHIVVTEMGISLIMPAIRQKCCWKSGAVAQ